MSDSVLRLTQVAKSYNPGATTEVPVLQGADLHITAGEIVALVAPSGAGKSTLLHVAGLLDTPDRGEVWIADRETSTLTDRSKTEMRRRDIGFIYQFHHLLPEFSAQENICLPQQANGVASGPSHTRAKELLQHVGLAARADHRPAALSGGEQQRVAICRALANRPRLLLADEPTGNLDPATSDQVFDMLLGLARDTGLAALIATHNHDLASRMDRIVQLRNGVIEAARE